MQLSLYLFLKKTGVVFICDFRQISLIGSTFKTLAKVLANRLRGVLRYVISLDHAAFVDGR